MPLLCSYPLLTHGWQHKQRQSCLSFSPIKYNNDKIPVRLGMKFYTRLYMGHLMLGFSFSASLSLRVTHVSSVFSSWRSAAGPQQHPKTPAYYCRLSRKEKADWGSTNRANPNLDESRGWNPFSFLYAPRCGGFFIFYFKPLKQTPVFPVDQQSSA